jgi:Putative auto-transporter adhesin, head GIN domain
MKRTVVLCLLAVLLAGCSTPAILTGKLVGSGNLVSHSYDLNGFTKIEANDAAQIEVTRGDTYSVNVETDDNVAPRLEVKVTGDTLHIGLTEGSVGLITLRAQVTMPTLTSVTLDGASTLHAGLDGEDLAVDVKGASAVTLSGTAGRVQVKADGAGRALLSGLAVGDVSVNANGASRVEVNSSGAVTGKADGASTVVVSGTPTSVTVQTDGISRVITQ